MRTPHAVGFPNRRQIENRPGISRRGVLAGGLLALAGFALRPRQILHAREAAEKSHGRLKIT